MRHQDVSLGNIHIAYNWTYANSAARLAGAYDATDAGKFARQTDDDSLWMLASATGGWVQIGGGSAGVTSARASGSSQLTGDIQFLGASGIVVSQSGQIIYIAGDGVGVQTVGKAGYPLFGDVLVAPGYGMAIDQSGQIITFTATGSTVSLSNETPADVASAGASGSSSVASRGDHIHKGVHALMVTGSSGLYGDVFLVQGANVTLSQVGQVISIAASGGGGTGTAYNGTPEDVSSAGASGSSDLYARGNHIHKGVHSVRATGSAQLFGDVELVGASGTVVSQSGQVIYIAGGAGGGGNPLTVKEIDGAPTVSNVTTIRFTNGSVTDDGGGQVSVSTAGGTYPPALLVYMATTFA